MRLFHFNSRTAAPIAANVVSYQSSRLLTNYWRVEMGWNLKTCLQERDLKQNFCKKIDEFDGGYIVRENATDCPKY